MKAGELWAGREGGRGCTGLRKTGIFPGRGRLGGKGGTSLGKTGIFPRRGREGGKGGKVGGTDLGKTSVFPGRGCVYLGKSAVFPSLAAGMWGGWRGVSLSVGGPAWEDLLSSPGAPGRLPDCYLGIIVVVMVMTKVI